MFADDGAVGGKERERESVCVCVCVKHARNIYFSQHAHHFSTWLSNSLQSETQIFTMILFDI
jgi:hypothetical protein